MDFIVLLFLISSRFLFFISFVKHQKVEFRKQLIEQNSIEIKKLELNHEALYKDGNGLEWKENNKELVINGVYHEVISVIKTNGNFLLLLLEDKEENTLFKNFFHLNKQAKNSLLEISNLLLALNYLENRSELSLNRAYINICYTPNNCFFKENSFKRSLLKPPGKLLIS